ncbi:MAG: pyrroline-5-carboxylate reductase [Deltaproteobacteria bacterium]|jgi:pyrroline-5-carboxylate reductase|nr:pyrroline-5-carboxylate reductase [Deltaproteobacteria bacterium]
MAKVGFLGYGRMAKAISQGLIASELIALSEQAYSDPIKALDNPYLTRAVDNSQLVSISETVVVAVKPHQVLDVLNEVKEEAKNRLIVSIAAGVKLKSLTQCLHPSTKIVRVLPNLPALCQCGLTIICSSSDVESSDLKKVETIFKAVGEVEYLDESYFDQATALSGSGPAYFFLIFEAMIRGAVRLGLSWETARRMVLSTALGSVKTALNNSNLSLSQLRDQVTSPGGTTAEALHQLEKGALTALISEALSAASLKSQQLG